MRSVPASENGWQHHGAPHTRSLLSLGARTPLTAHGTNRPAMRVLFFFFFFGVPPRTVARRRDTTQLSAIFTHDWERSIDEARVRVDAEDRARSLDVAKEPLIVAAVAAAPSDDPVASLSSVTAHPYRAPATYSPLGDDERRSE